MKARIREAASTAILEAAEDVAATRGLEATSIAAIAERAGVAVGTLYNYFVDRDALLQALFNMRRDELLPQLIEAADEAKDLPFAERLPAYLGAVAETFDDFRQFCKVAMSNDAATSKFKPRQSIVLSTVINALVEILSPVVGNRAEEYAHMLFGALKALMQARIERDEPLAPAAELVVETFVKGIA